VGFPTSLFLFRFFSSKPARFKALTPRKECLKSRNNVRLLELLPQTVTEPTGVRLKLEMARLLIVTAYSHLDQN